MRSVPQRMVSPSVTRHPVTGSAIAGNFPAKSFAMNGYPAPTPRPNNATDVHLLAPARRPGFLRLALLIEMIDILGQQRRFISRPQESQSPRHSSCRAADSVGLLDQPAERPAGLNR